MIVVPRDPREWQLLAEFLREYAHVMPTPDTHVFGWVSDGKIMCAVAMQGFLGKVCQIHVAYAPGWHFTPRALLRTVFRHAFVTTKRDMLLGVVNSQNAKAMRLDRHLGFRELYRIPGMHDHGGDMVLLGLTKDNCRWFDDAKEAQSQGAYDATTTH